jgi:hypothetical protein
MIATLKQLATMLFSRDVETSRQAEINLLGGGLAQPGVPGHDASWPTLEAYLRSEYAEGKNDHALRAELGAGCVTFYIHPANRGGDTQNYELRGNQLRHDPRIK